MIKIWVLRKVTQLKIADNQDLEEDGKQIP